MHLAFVLLVLTACGRVNFEGSSDGGVTADQLSITSPIPNAEVRGSATLAGRCVTGVPIALSGSGLDSPREAVCTAGNYSVQIFFTEGDGEKIIAVSQGGVTVMRTFVRVTPVPMMRSMSTGTVPSAGFMIDCDLQVTAPAGMHEGDFLVGMIYTDGGAPASISTPGFNRLALDSDIYVAFTKFASATEPDRYTFRIVAGINPADTCESAVALVAFTNIDEPAVLAQSGGADNDDTMIVAPSLMATNAGLLVGVWGSNGPASGITQPTNMLLGARASSANDNANALVAYQLVGEGITGDRTATVAATRAAAGGLVLLRVVH